MDLAMELPVQSGYAKALEKRRQQQQQTVRKQPEQPLQADGMATSPRQNPAKPSPAEPLPSQQPQQQPTGRHSPSASGAGGQEADTGLDAATAPPTRGLSALGTSMRQTRLQALATRQRSGGKPEARALGRLRTPRKVRPAITLSSVLHQAPQLFQRTKVAVVERFVTHIDDLPSRFHDAQTVYLSKNSLQSTDGIRQFQAVGTLSLADNLLSDLDTVLADLGTLPNLVSLSLEGNPCASLPFYRAHVVARLPRLLQLDGREVKPEERSAAAALVAQEEAFLATMTRNACVVHKMARVFQQMLLHRELFATLYGRRLKFVRGIAPSSVPVNPQRLLELWDYEGSLSAQERAAVLAALRREVARRRESKVVAALPERAGPNPAQLPNSASWDNSYTEVMVAQQQSIAQLLDLINSARLELAEEVRDRVTGGVINDMHSEEDVRRRVLQDDREQLVSGLREAFQQLSPGSKAPLGSATRSSGYTGGYLSPNQRSPVVQSRRDLKDQATRVLFKATQGSAVSSHSHSPERKLQIEGGRQAQRHQLGHQQHQTRPHTAGALVGTSTSLHRPSNAQQPSKAAASREGAPSQGGGDETQSRSSPRPASRGVGSVTPAAASGPRRPQSAGPGSAGRHGAGTAAGGRGRSAPPGQRSESSIKLSLRKAVASRVQEEMQEEQHKQKRMPSEAKAQPRHPPARLVLQPEGNQRPESPPWKLPGKNPVREAKTRRSASPRCGHSSGWSSPREDAGRWADAGEEGGHTSMAIHASPAMAPAEGTLLLHSEAADGVTRGFSGPQQGLRAADASAGSRDDSLHPDMPVPSSPLLSQGPGSAARQAHPTLTAQALLQLRQRTQHLQQAILEQQQHPMLVRRSVASGVAAPLAAPPPPPPPPFPAQVAREWASAPPVMAGTANPFPMPGPSLSGGFTASLSSPNAGLASPAPQPHILPPHLQPAQLGVRTHPELSTFLQQQPQYPAPVTHVQQQQQYPATSTQTQQHPWHPWQPQPNAPITTGEAEVGAWPHPQPHPHAGAMPLEQAPQVEVSLSLLPSSAPSQVSAWGQQPPVSTQISAWGAHQGSMGGPQQAPPTSGAYTSHAAATIGPLIPQRKKGGDWRQTHDVASAAMGGGLSQSSEPGVSEWWPAHVPLPPPMPHVRSQGVSNQRGIGLPPLPPPGVPAYGRQYGTAGSQGIPPPLPYGVQLPAYPPAHVGQAELASAAQQYLTPSLTPGTTSHSSPALYFMRAQVREDVTHVWDPRGADTGAQVATATLHPGQHTSQADVQHHHQQHQHWESQGAVHSEDAPASSVHNLRAAAQGVQRALFQGATLQPANRTEHTQQQQPSLRPGQPMSQQPQDGTTSISLPLSDPGYDSQQQQQQQPFRGAEEHHIHVHLYPAAPQESPLSSSHAVTGVTSYTSAPAHADQHPGSAPATGTTQHMLQGHTSPPASSAGVTLQGRHGQPGLERSFQAGPEELLLSSRGALAYEKYERYTPSALLAATGLPTITVSQGPATGHPASGHSAAHATHSLHHQLSDPALQHDQVQDQDQQKRSSQQQQPPLQVAASPVILEPPGGFTTFSAPSTGLRSSAGPSGPQPSFTHTQQPTLPQQQQQHRRMGSFNSGPHGSSILGGFHTGSSGAQLQGAQFHSGASAAGLLRNSSAGFSMAGLSSQASPALGNNPGSVVQRPGTAQRVGTGTAAGGTPAVQGSTRPSTASGVTTLRASLDSRLPDLRAASTAASFQAQGVGDTALKGTQQEINFSPWTGATRDQQAGLQQQAGDTASGAMLQRPASADSLRLLPRLEQQVIAMQEELQQQAQERHLLMQAQQQLASQVQEASSQEQQQQHLASLLLPASPHPNANRTTGLTGMAVKELESQLVGLALEREALEKALLSEQGEGALLRRELDMQAVATDTLGAALADTKQHLEDVQTALATQTMAVGEAQDLCEQLHKQEALLQQELTSLQSKLEEAASQIQSKEEALSRKEEECARLEEGLARVRAEQERRHKQEEIVDHKAWASRARRGLHDWRRAAGLRKQERNQEAAAGKLATWWLLHRALRQWQSTVRRTKVLYGLAARSQRSVQAWAFSTWRAYCKLRRYKHGSSALAQQHRHIRTLLVTFNRWRLIARRHASAMAHEDPRTSLLAVTYTRQRLLHAAWGAWRSFILTEARPRVNAHRRAVRSHARRWLRSCLHHWEDWAYRRQAKRSLIKRLDIRYQVRVLNQAWMAWVSLMDAHQSRKLTIQAGDMQRHRRWLLAWRDAARHQSHVKRQILAMATRRHTWTVAEAWSAWREFVRQCKHKALSLAMAVTHHSRSVTYRAFWAWSRAAELAAVARAQAQGILEFQRLLQVVMRWRRLSEGVARQGAVMQRAIRMYNFRYLQALQRSVLQAWYAQCEAVREQRRATGAAFTHAFLVTHAHLTLWSAWSAWRRAVLTSARERGVRAAAAAAESQAHAQQLESRLSRTVAEQQALLEALDKATAQLEQVPVLQAQLAESREDESEAQAQVVALTERVEQVAAERDALWAEAQALAQKVTAADAGAEALRSQVASLQRSLESAQAGTRDLQLKLTQQAALAEQEASSLREDLSASARELSSTHAALARVEADAAEREHELQGRCDTLEIQVEELRKEVVARDAQIDFLSAHAQGGSRAGVAAADVGLPVPPGLGTGSGGAGGPTMTGTSGYYAHPQHQLHGFTATATAGLSLSAGHTQSVSIPDALAMVAARSHHQQMYPAVSVPPAPLQPPVAPPSAPSAGYNTTATIPQQPWEPPSAAELLQRARELQQGAERTRQQQAIHPSRPQTASGGQAAEGSITSFMAETLQQLAVEQNRLRQPSEGLGATAGSSKA